MKRYRTSIRILITLIVACVMFICELTMIRSTGIRDEHVFSGLPCVIRPASVMTVFVTPNRSGFRGVDMLTAVEAESPDIVLDILRVPEGDSIRSVRSDSDTRRIFWRFAPVQTTRGNPVQLRLSSADSDERIFLSCLRDESGRERPRGFLIHEYGGDVTGSVTRWFDDRINPFVPFRCPPAAGLLLFLLPLCLGAALTWCITDELLP